jgi:general L-amino acid transport system substrate-binding protein
VAAWIAMAVALTALFSAPAQAGETLDLIRARDELRCGVSEGILGFSAPDSDGRWSGLDADFCRAVAAAVLGDPEKVAFVPLKSSTRFPALLAKKVDLVVRHATWTLTREALLGVQFPAVLFYDGQGFLVANASPVKTVADLNGRTVCVEKGTTHVQNLVDYFGAQGGSVEPLVIDSAAEVADGLFTGRCEAYTSDVSQLAAARQGAPGGPQAFTILPERISKEPLGPVVRGDDLQWVTVVRWALYALVAAEEHGITGDNVDAQSGKSRKWRLFLGEDPALATALGVSPDWGVRAVKAVGNYGEMYERNVGSGGPLGLERGLNRLWTQGGLLYAPPLD